MLTKSKFYLVLIFSILVASCTYTKPKNPIFNDIDKFKYNFGNLIKAEKVNINGKEITKGKVSTSELEINIINGKNLPTTEDERKSLSKSLAKAVKNYLKDSNQFETYQVKYGKKSEGAGVSIERYISDSFKSSEL